MVPRANPGERKTERFGPHGNLEPWCQPSAEGKKGENADLL